MSMKNRSGLLTLAACWLLSGTAGADPVTPGDITSYSTPQSIGIEWDVTGDSNHNAAVTVEYSVEGAGDWKPAMPLLRMDSKGRNMLAGSIFYLRGATSYEVRLVMSDPDGGGETRTITVATRPVPELAAGGPVYHVVPGSGGGSGTEADPYRGIAAAQQDASSGDTFRLHAGDYGGPVTFDRGGSGNGYIAWVAAGDGPAHFDGVLVGADRIWLEGLEIVLDDNALRSSTGTSDVVIKGNTITGCHYCIHLRDTDQNWWISDNTIVGDEPPTSGSLSGEGIELQHSSGHTVAYNSISFVADGISYPHKNVDIFGNDIFECSDDGIEPDYGYENIRVWGNRIHHAHHNGISFQPMDGGPWYVLRNQVIGCSESVLKFREVTHAFVAHNTFVAWTLVQGEAGWLRNLATRNNVLVTMTGSYIFEDTGNSGVDDNWRTDLDYDGVAWGESSLPKFKWFNVRYDDLAAFQSASGREVHAVEMPLSCFEALDIPGPPPAVIPPHLVILAEGCIGIDYGEVLPNINDDYIGDAPDLGAHERGAPPLHYGPRDNDAGTDDGGTPDAGTEDAGTQDAATQDAGTRDDDQPQDGGNGSDSGGDNGGGIAGSGCGCSVSSTGSSRCGTGLAGDGLIVLVFFLSLFSRYLASRWPGTSSSTRRAALRARSGRFWSR